MILLAEGSGVYPADEEERFKEGSKELKLNADKVYIREVSRVSMFDLISDLAVLHSAQLDTLRGIYQNEIPLGRTEINGYLNTLHDIGEKWQRDIEQLEKSFRDVVNFGTESAENK